MLRYKKFEHPISGENYKFLLPEKCPLCMAGISADPKYVGSMLYNKGEGLLYIVTECCACGNPFMSTYLFPSFPCTINEHDDYPSKCQYKVFENEILTKFSDFVVIYHQAEYAEKAGLLDICGPGYRKALEFLIKSYVSNLMPEKREAIETESLSQTVNRITNEKLRKTAINSTWLGNDFTHYKRKYENKELSDLKNFIDATVYWIMMETITSENLK